MPVTIHEQSQQLQAAAADHLPSEVVAVFDQSIQDLLAEGVPADAVKVGDTLESFTLTDATGATVTLGQLIERGPAVIVFYRGGWCPYCNLELRAFQQILPDIKAARASLVAISPEKPDDTLTTAQKNSLSFEVLSDVGQKVGRAFGLVYQFSDELKSAYGGFGLDIPAKNGADEWALPISATYVIDRDGMIIYAYTDPDYRDRADPLDVLKVLKQQPAAVV